jgi:DNA-binding NtrC family response regulator
MHGRTGVDLLRVWKDRRPSTPFIFVTGVFEIAQVVEAVKLGAEDYITKPFNASDLLRRVAECIDAAHEDVPELALEGSPGATLKVPPDMTMDELERLAIESALKHFAGNRTHAAESLGISVRTLQRKLKAWSNGALPRDQHQQLAANG